LRLARVCLLLLTLVVAACTRAPELSYDGSSFRAEGWRGSEPAGGWDEVLAVYASDAPGAPPMLGDYTRRGGALVFTPRFPPAPGLPMRAVYRPPGAPPLEQRFTQDAAVAQAAAVLTGVYPSAEVWPANTLKLYVEFSGPMRQSDAFTRIHLLDEGGAVVDDAFVELDQALWDRSGRRLTILFEPGRIKRGVGPNETVGPPLLEGRRYVLVVDAGWPDANGRPLTTGARKPFLAGPPVRARVDPKTWRITPPAARTREPLSVAFPRLLDYALAQSAIHVRRDGKPVQGDIAISANETQWRFIPREAWRAGDYALHVEARMEDVAGNNLGRIFDPAASDAATMPDSARSDEEVAFRVAG